MGRFIDLDKPLSDDDRAYLIERRREAEVVVNDRRFGDLTKKAKAEEAKRVDQDRAAQEAEDAALDEAIAAEEEDSYPPHLVDKVFPLTVTQLRTALKKRNLDATGNKEDLQIRLIEYLEEQEKAKQAKAEEQETALRSSQQPEAPIAGG